MKSLSKVALVAASLALSLSANVSAKSDSRYLAECKNTVRAQFNDVEKIDIASINSRRNLFRAKLRVKADGERALVTCEIRGDEPIALTCKKGKACGTQSVAAS